MGMRRIAFKLTAEHSSDEAAYSMPCSTNAAEAMRPYFWWRIPQPRVQLSKDRKNTAREGAYARGDAGVFESEMVGNG